jgi:hypothetical protein
MNDFQDRFPVEHISGEIVVKQADFPLAFNEVVLFAVDEYPPDAISDITGPVIFE